MLTRDRAVALVTISLLNVFIVAAGLAVIRLDLDDKEAPATARAPGVADRPISEVGKQALAKVDSSAPVPAPAAMSARLSGLLGGAGRPGAAVIDVKSGTVLFGRRQNTWLVPASTTKLVTSTAVLAAAGPDKRLTTKVVRAGDGIVLVGGGDPLLATSPSKTSYPRAASLTDLAKQTATALKGSGTTRVKVGYDTSLYRWSGPAPGWKSNYMPDGEAAPVTALQVDKGRGVGTGGRASDPPRTAAVKFAKLLGKYGVKAKAGSRTTAPAGAQQLAAVESPSIGALVEFLMTHSDNDVAEAMARQVALARGKPATFSGGTAAVRETLAELGVRQGVRTYDGSGLSIRNRITPAALAQVAAVAAAEKHPGLRPAITGMPVAGFSGTLAGRAHASSAGVVRAKTGTLNGVSTLAGLAYDADGRVLAFAFMANGEGAGPAGLDRLAAAVASCGCR